MAKVEPAPWADRDPTAPSTWSDTSATANNHSEPEGYATDKPNPSAAAPITTPADNHPPSDPPPPDTLAPPDGGALAWMQVVAAFSVFFNTWGMLNTFGVFQTYYESGALFQGASSSTISWIGCIQAFAVLATGLLSGPIYDRGYLRHLLAAGSFLVVFGFFMLSICKTYWQVLLAQGFSVGIGAGLLFVPTVAVLPTYFKARLGLAVGLAAAGSSVGGIIYPIMFYNLLDKVGFGWSTRIMAFTALATLAVPLVVLKMRVRPAKARDIFDWSAFTDWPYVAFTLGGMVGFIGLYVMLVYMSYFSAASGIADPAMAFYLVPILNAASTFGRTLPNYLSDKIGPLNLFGPAAAVCAALTLAMIAVTNLAGVTVIALLYGFFSGVFVALPPVCFVQLTKDKSKIGTRIGMGMATCGLGVLASGPGGGAIIGTHPANLHWDRLWIFGGCLMIASGIILSAVRFWLTKGKLLVKV
ncbi:major facilitator superfamily domain-containing protein [Chaetomium tenue]|uniref:Major facilitator superfamily domain-containing protein n=1 Tax=Chaetomium tenue TaxID=1854479 RepID=A0ACB7NVR5_9PEZI|nr:major facilitator superfamily domain-containing protein [Chaetomium globosum]